MAGAAIETTVDGNRPLSHLLLDLARWMLTRGVGETVTRSLSCAVHPADRFG